MAVLLCVMPPANPTIRVPGACWMQFETSAAAAPNTYRTDQDPRFARPTEACMHKREESISKPQTNRSTPGKKKPPGTDLTPAFQQQHSELAVSSPAYRFAGEPAAQLGHHSRISLHHFDTHTHTTPLPTSATQPPGRCEKKVAGSPSQIAIAQIQQVLTAQPVAHPNCSFCVH